MAGELPISSFCQTLGVYNRQCGLDTLLLTLHAGRQEASAN